MLLKSLTFFKMTGLLCLVLLVSCEKAEDDNLGFDVPTSYTEIENVSFSGQTQRLAMFSEMKAYMAESQTFGTVLSAEKLKAQFANDASLAGWEGTYEESKQLKGKTFESEAFKFDALMDELAELSSIANETFLEIGGFLSSADGTKTYLIGNDGLDHAQLIEKGLMGACLYYQAAAVYFGEGKMNVDNELVTAGEGTEMEHHWDEAFGYYGVPLDFPTSTDGLVFWGDYSNQRDALLDCNQSLMDAFLLGRSAISNKALDSRDDAISSARNEWERIVAASAIHYLNSGMANINDQALLYHGISEAIGLIYGLQFNPERKVTNAQVSSMLTLLAGSDDFSQMNIVGLSSETLESVKSLLVDYYDMASIADEL